MACVTDSERDIIACRGLAVGVEYGDGCRVGRKLRTYERHIVLFRTVKMQGMTIGLTIQQVVSDIGDRNRPYDLVERTVTILLAATLQTEENSVTGIDIHVRHTVRVGRGVVLGDRAAPYL